MGLPGLLAAAVMLLPVGNALALSGTPVKVGEPLKPESPAVAVDSSGTAYIAWDDAEDQGGEHDFIQYCVLPSGTHTCSQSGNLTPAGSAEHIDRVQVLVDGSTVVVLANVRGATEESTPEQEWQSTDGGQSFSPIQLGKSVANGGTPKGEAKPLNAVIVPGSGELGYGWSTAGGSPTFDAFPLSSPPQCSLASCPPEEHFAELEPSVNPDQIGDAGGELASQSGGKAGVLGIFDTAFSEGPFGCIVPISPNDAAVTHSGFAFAYGSGEQSKANSYDVAPGQAGSAWRAPVAQAGCGLEEPAVAGGPSGFGVLGYAPATGLTLYQRFDEADHSFDTDGTTIMLGGEREPSLSQDGSGSVYATFRSGVSGSIELAYSYDGGTTWSGPALLEPDAGEGDRGVTSSVDAAGQGWVAWTNGGSVYAQQFDAADSVAPAQPTSISTVQASGSSSGASLSILAGTVGETDQATIEGANAAQASGTLEYALYSAPTCVASSKVFSSTSPVAGSKVPASAPVTSALAAGTYYWQDSYSGNAGNDQGVRGNLPSASDCGSEKLTVTPPSTSKITSPPSIGGSAKSNGRTITVTIACSTTPCTVTVKITHRNSGPIHPAKGHATLVRSSKKASETILLGSGTFTIRRKGPQKLTIHLTKAGRKTLASHHRRLQVTVLASEKVEGATLRSIRAVKISPAARPRRKHRR